MYGEFLEFFPEFFDRIISINQFFFCKELSEVISGQCIYCITLCIHVVFHYFLNEYSNLKAECKKDIVHDAFDAIYVSYIDNRSRDFLCNFFHPRPVMVDIVCSLPPEPAVLCAHALHERRWVGPRLRARLVGGAWAYLWLHTRDLVLLVCL